MTVRSESYRTSRLACFPALTPDNGHAAQCNGLGFGCVALDKVRLIRSGRHSRGQGAIRTTRTRSSQIWARIRGNRAIGGGDASPRIPPNERQTRRSAMLPGPAPGCNTSEAGGSGWTQIGPPGGAPCGPAPMLRPGGVASTWTAESCPSI